MTNFDTQLKQLQIPMKEATKDLVRIPSFLVEGGDGYPFGKAVHEALQKATDIAAGLGFRTSYDGAGYYAWAEIGRRSSTSDPGKGTVHPARPVRR